MRIRCGRGSRNPRNLRLGPADTSNAPQRYTVPKRLLIAGFRSAGGRVLTLDSHFQERRDLSSRPSRALNLARTTHSSRVIGIAGLTREDPMKVWVI